MTIEKKTIFIHNLLQPKWNFIKQAIIYKVYIQVILNESLLVLVNIYLISLIYTKGNITTVTFKTLTLHSG